MKMNINASMRLSGDYYADRMTELSLSLLIPLLSNHLMEAPPSGNERVLGLLESALIRWEFLTGREHEADALYPKLFSRYYPIQDRQPLTKDGKEPYIVSGKENGDTSGQPPPPRKSG